jgi:hypothetical protein
LRNLWLAPAPAVPSHDDDGDAHEKKARADYRECGMNEKCLAAQGIDSKVGLLWLWLQD